MGRVINFVSCKGGIGKSSIIYTLAMGLSEKNYRICIFDGCFRFDTYSSLNRGGKDFKEYLLGSAGTEDVLIKLKKNCYFVKTDCYYFDYNSHTELVKFFIDEVSTKFDFIFIDSCVFDLKTYREFLEVSKEVFIIVNDEPEVVKNTAKLIFDLNNYRNINNRKVIINKARIITQMKGDCLSETEIENLLKTEVLFMIPKILKNNHFKLSKSGEYNNKIPMLFCYSVITNKKTIINYKKRYNGLVGSVRRFLYGRFE